MIFRPQGQLSTFKYLVKAPFFAHVSQIFWACEFWLPWEVPNLRDVNVVVVAACQQRRNELSPSDVASCSIGNLFGLEPRCARNLYHYAEIAIVFKLGQFYSTAFLRLMKKLGKLNWKCFDWKFNLKEGQKIRAAKEWLKRQEWLFWKITIF